MHCMIQGIYFRPRSPVPKLKGFRNWRDADIHKHWKTILFCLRNAHIVTTTSLGVVHTAAGLSLSSHETVIIVCSYLEGILRDLMCTHLPILKELCWSSSFARSCQFEANRQPLSLVLLLVLHCRKFYVRPLPEVTQITSTLR